MIVGNFEIFINRDYYSMWSIRRIGSGSEAIPFLTRAEAQRAAEIIESWIKEDKSAE